MESSHLHLLHFPSRYWINPHTKMSSSVDEVLAELSTFLGLHTPLLPNSLHFATTQTPHTSNTVYLSLTAEQQLTSFSTGQYDRPSAYLSWSPHTSPSSTHTHFLAFQCSEFALPVRANDSSLQFNFFSRPDFVRPHSILPLIAMSRASSSCIMLAPVDSFHEQVLAVVDVAEGRRELRWGLSGDLDNVPAGFCATLAVICGNSPRDLMATWGTLVRKHATLRGHILNRRGRYADVSIGKLSMWTDNGASYWYRTEKGMDLPSTLEATVAQLRKQNVPIASVELDSWFYHHEITRPVTDVGYPNVVPPTGMLRWEPREDVLGQGGIYELRQRIGNPPLILHSRHISSKSDYQTDSSLSNETWWVDSDRAHPQGSAVFRKWMQQAADWGATTYEQDWLVEVWLGVRQLREAPCRIETWQRQLDSAAREQNVSLIWCMATPADMALAVSLEQIVAMRSCDDYRYAKDPSILWRWHLTVSCLIRSLGLLPFKDVFMSSTNNLDVPDIDGDPHAMLEACLSALSAGPVGIGDRVGRTNPDLVRKTCRCDGVLIKPDVPLAAIDRSIRNPSGLLWAETNCSIWRYVVVIRTGEKSQNLGSHTECMTETLQLDTAKLLLVYDWKSKTACVATSVSAALRLHEWILWVLCPIVNSNESDSAFALIGDANAFATMGDRRFRTESQNAANDSMYFDVIGLHGEEVEVSYWTSKSGILTKNVSIPARGWAHCSLRIDANQVMFQSD